MASNKRYVELTLLGTIGIEMASIFAYQFPIVAWPLLIIIGVVVLVATTLDLRWAIYALAIELCIGSQGHLLTGLGGPTPVSLRMILFTAVFLGWCGYLLRRGVSLTVFFSRDRFWWLFAIVVGLGVVSGLYHNQTRTTIQDANAWFFFALLGVVLYAGRHLDWQKFFIVVATATSYLMIKTIVLLVAFSHGWFVVGDYTYNWLRGAALAEITHVTGTIFRIFIQSQLYGMVGGLIALSYLIWLGKKKLGTTYRWYLLYAYGAGVTLITSQSRSFWLGTIAGLIIVIVGARRLKRITTFSAVRITGLIMICLVSQFLLVQLLTGNLTDNVLKNRFNNVAAEPAGLSRLNQLQPLLSAIQVKPLWGYGFGKTLTYRSSDPRVLVTHPDGWYTAYAFEWGYLDIVLKIGLLGLLIYLAWLSEIGWIGIQKMRQAIAADDPATLSITIGLIAGIGALLITNIFSPYLNHPLGIGLLMLTAAFFYPRRATQ